MMNLDLTLLAFADGGLVPGQTPNLLNWLFGAGLGASFYVLTKTQPYLVDRSFDPKYNSAYLSRIVIGIVAGVILAFTAGALIGEKNAGVLAKLSSGVIAIIGGYSAEAVQQVLQRLADILVAVVRGDNSAQVKAELAAQNAEKSKQARDKIVDAKAAHATGKPDEVTKALSELDSVLRK
jgi:hypothetical protein